MTFAPAAPYRLLVPLPADLSLEKRAMLRRIEVGVWSGVLISLVVSWVAHLLIDLTGHSAPAAAGWHFVAALGPGVPVTALILRFAFVRSAAQARQETQLHELQAREARLDGALLVARTVAHRINNAISPVAGYAELLMQDSDVPGSAGDPKTHAYAALIAEAAAQTVEEVKLLQRIVRLEEDPTSPISILDVEASATPPTPAAETASAVR